MCHRPSRLLLRSVCCFILSPLSPWKYQSSRSSRPIFKIAPRRKKALPVAHNEPKQQHYPLVPSHQASIDTMSSDSTEKHSCDSTPSGVDAKRLRVANDSTAPAADAAPGVAGLSAIPVDCGVRVLSFLTEEDVPSAAQLSRKFWEASHHDCHPQSRTVVVTCGGSAEGNSIASTLPLRYLKLSWPCTRLASLRASTRPN